MYEGGVTVFSLKLWRPLAESRVRVPKTCHVSSSFFKVKKSVKAKKAKVTWNCELDVLSYAFAPFAGPFFI